MISRRLFLLELLVLLASCQDQTSSVSGKLIVGLVSYGDGISSISELENFKNYLSEQLKTIIELEPAFNEIKAIEQIQKQVWALVFAPPGLAAIAISKSGYLPLFPLEGISNLRSVIVVLDNSPIRQLKDLSGKVISLGENGSATGYYLPIYNLYGTTLAEVRIASTPKTVLESIAKQEVVAGALSKAEFERYRSDFPETKFRILYIDPHNIPSGAILVSPQIERNQLEQIRQVMKAASPDIAQSAGYITNGNVPDYKYMIQVVERVMPIAQKISQKPAPLY
ncbi:phosphate/phosphite/phosphonate ABC transporter substrate-binding protein [Merismopedia glauca]|uniref:Phosphonate ABC transporter substrate-binding protein n=1 Tax=Merismopedia glauca CCAP 1448/3 TaxID=1296344 RepID=A0A2T1C5Q8_9CYAN|nr:PhnD/SsuA/transferrin family substrate-binding protein [Merismopedia glauca]PSB03463.1 phosphonate ABC transporter substrate-binding protein [Merismopedia glauca CCAP 1448/3]